MKRGLKAIRDRVARYPGIYRALRRVWKPPRRIYQHLPYVGPFTVVVEPGTTMVMLSYGDVLENDMFWSGFGGGWEAEPLKLWRQLSRDADVVLDIGANTGLFALAAQAIRPDARVIAFEPSPRVVERLRANIAANRFPIEVEAVAASDANGEAIFFDFPGDHQYSASLDPGMGGTIETRVATVRIDDLLECRGIGRVDLVKLDVELHEPAVLRGMRHCLERDRPAILIEVLNDSKRREVEGALDGIGYRWTAIADEEGRNFLLTAR